MQSHGSELQLVNVLPVGSTCTALTTSVCFLCSFWQKTTVFLYKTVMRVYKPITKHGWMVYCGKLLASGCLLINWRQWVAPITSASLPRHTQGLVPSGNECRRQPQCSAQWCSSASFKTIVEKPGCHCRLFHCGDSEGPSLAVLAVTW